VPDLLAYQADVVTSPARFTWSCWARQTGKSFTFSLRRLLRGLARRRDQIILSAGERQSREVMEKARMHCVALKIWHRWNGRGTFRGTRLRQLEIRLPGGVRIIGLPANPLTARGFYWGDVLLVYGCDAAEGSSKRYRSYLLGEHGMKGFNDLEIFGTFDALESLLNRIDASLTNGWKRDEEGEAKASRIAGLDYSCYVCDERDDRRGAGLFLLPDTERGCLEVVNIVPRKMGQLSCAEYNRILEDFHVSFVKPIVRKHGVRAKLSAPRPWTPRPLRGVLKRTLDTVTMIYQHTRHPELKTRALHPNDQERYWRFIRVAHQYQSTLHPSDIAYYLTEAGFHEELVAELEQEYRIGRQVLAIHDDPWDLRRIRKEERKRRKKADAAEYERVFGKPPAAKNLT